MAVGFVFSGTRVRRALGASAAALNLAGLAAGFLYTLVPSAEAAGHLFGWILPAAVADACVVCSMPRAPRRPSAVYLAWTGLGFAILPFLLIARAGFLTPFVFDAASRLVVLGSLGSGFVAAVSRPSSGRPDFAGKDRRARPAAAAAGFFVGIAALAIAARFLTGPHPRTAGVLIPQCLPYWSLSFLAVGAATARSGGGESSTRRGAGLLALPAVAAAILGGMPVYQTPGVLRTAEREFTRVFEEGPGPQDREGSDTAAFSPGRMFLGTPAGRILPILDVPYLAETVPDGRTFTFRYDAWPPNQKGPRPVLIRIHGGAWVSGDKGYGNINNVNRHFASRGYLVFDLQYGLAETGTFRPRSPTPEGMLGPYGIEDMLRHIGRFTTYLADRAEELGADTSRVFVSGASAGGHLALAVALAGASGYTREHPGTGPDPRVTIRGVIPFYPGIGYAASMGIPTPAELDFLEPLLGPANPPALFYQGSLDGMVDPARVRGFVEAYNRAGGGSAVLVEFPSAGHGSDLIFWNPYGQVFLRYMERFMDRFSGQNP